MKIEFYKSLWGFEDIPRKQMFGRIAAAGFCGFESPMHLDLTGYADHGLQYIAQGFPVTADEVKRDIEQAHKLGAKLLNLQVGRDYWPMAVGIEFLESALEIIHEAPLPVAFETHRGRLFYSAASTAPLLALFHNIRLTADFSHWTCVSESMLEDQAPAVDAAIQRSIYIHARVGYEEGPQAPDPWNPRWRPQLAGFAAWWKRIAEAHRDRGESVLRIDPEFGPANYMQMEDDRPLSDLWEVCVWMRDRLAETLP